ncbi:reverse transcriptase domain-containing protein [Tanacetum coccineum]
MHVYVFSKATYTFHLGRVIPAALREYCDKYYHQLLSIIAEKVHQEKIQQEKLKEVKAHLNFKGCSGKNSKIQEVSQHSESRTLDARDLRRKLRIRRDRSESPRHRPKGRRDGGVFKRLGGKGKSVSAHSKSRYHSYHSRRMDPAPKRIYHERTSSRDTEAFSESEDSRGRHWKSRSKKAKLSIEEDELSQLWVCEETDPFTPRIRYLELPKKSRMPNNVKTYDESDDPRDHLKIFQAAAKVERWAMPTWCHMFNSTLTGSARVWFDYLPPESIDSYDDLKKAFLANYLQQKKCIKDPVEIHHIKQRERESTKDFVQRFKAESRHVKGAPKCMRIYGFMHGITNPELIKRLHDNIPKSVDEMMREVERKQNFDRKGDFRSQQRSERRRDKFTLLRKSPKEILALYKGKFKAPPPMTTPNGKLSHMIKELKQGSVKDQPKIAKKGETSGKDKPLAILMVQPWQRVARQKITQSFSPSLEISFPPLGDEDGAEGPMIIEAEIGGHFIHRIYVDGGLASEILYEHCFNRLRPEVKNQMVLATAPLIGFSGEIIWPMGQILLPIKIEDAEHFHLYMDKFCDSKITVCVQWDHKKARSEEDSSSPVNNSRNAKIPAQPFDIIQAAEEIIKVAIHLEYPEQTIAIGSTLIEEGRKALCDLLRCSLDVFAWKLADMTGVPRHIAEHRLNVREGCPPIRQKKRSQASERNKAIQEEVEKLVDAGIIKEVHYHSWLSNLVICKIDLKMESLCGYPFKCFLDAYKGNHQIKMDKEDEEKTTFIKSQGIFCYSKMPFGLKNAEATYQCLIDKAFQKQIGRNLEVYVNDLVIKSRSEYEIIRDMEETFKTLREINMKLNPKKCTFGVEEGTFLGYKVNTEGIMAGAAFKEMKKLIAELPTLTAPMEREELIMYLAAAREAVYVVLMTEIEAKQMSVYFVSRTLQGPKINYTSMEKLVLALVHASKRLKRYFQAYIIIVITDQPIKQILSRPKVAGRLQKWSIKLVERPEDDPLDTPMEAEEELPDPWTLFTDRSSCVDGSGAGLILKNPEGAEFTYALRFRFDATNNEAEYEALIAGLRIAEQMGVKNLQTNVDSRLVANHVNGSYIAKEPGMIQYLEKVKTLYSSFKKFSIKQVPRMLVVVEEDGDTWMASIYNYLTEETLLAEKEKARAVRRKSGSMHARTRSVVAKAIRTGYYWPTMHADAR